MSAVKCGSVEYIQICPPLMTSHHPIPPLFVITEPWAELPKSSCQISSTYTDIPSLHNLPVSPSHPSRSSEKHWPEPPLLHSTFPLAIYFTTGSCVHLSATLGNGLLLLVLNRNQVHVWDNRNTKFFFFFFFNSMGLDKALTLFKMCKLECMF